MTDGTSARAATGADPSPRVRVAPTVPGLVVAGVAAAAFVAAWTGAGVAAGVVAMFGGAAVLVSLAAAWIGGRGLRLAAPGTTLAQAGDRFVLRLAVMNASRRFAAYDAIVTRAERPRTPRRIGALVPAVAPLAQRPVEIDCGALRRGVHPQGVVDVETEAPAGLARCRVRFVLAHEVVALPRLGTLRGFAAGEAATRGARADGARVRADGHEFHGLRAWREGESLRHVHWKLSARRARLLLREFAADPRPPLLVVLSLTRPARGPGAEDLFEDAVSLAATLVEHHVRTGHDVRLAVAADAARVMPCPRGRDGLTSVLRALAEVEARPPGSAADLASALAARRHGESVVVVTAADARDGVRGAAGAVWMDVRDAAATACFQRTGRAAPGRALAVRR